MQKALSAQRNKTDRNDARGIAHMMRVGWFRQVHVKSSESQRLRVLAQRVEVDAKEIRIMGAKSVLLRTPLLRRARPRGGMVAELCAAFLCAEFSIERSTAHWLHSI